MVGSVLEKASSWIVVEGRLDEEGRRGGPSDDGPDLFLAVAAAVVVATVASGSL